MPLIRKSPNYAVLAALLVLSATGASAQEARPNLEFGIGWSALHLDDVAFTAITDFFVTEVLDHQENQDGTFNGYRLTGELSGLAARQWHGWHVSAGVKGFYSRYEDEQSTRCIFTASSECVFFPLIDPDPSGTIGLPGGADASGGFFSDWFTDVERKAVHWGAAIELDFSRYAATPAASLKDAPVAAPSPFIWTAGLAFRRLDQETSLFSEDFGPTLDPVTLDDDLDASYYGAYVGFSTFKPIGHHMRVKLTGETGLYYADADYHGAYTASANLGDDTPIAQSLTLSDSAPAFIGALGLSLERDFGPMTLALFGEAEWISYVPKVLYNDTDLNGGVPFDIVGFQDGTELGNGSALSYTLGARLKVSLD